MSNVFSNDPAARIAAKLGFAPESGPDSLSGTFQVSLRLPVPLMIKVDALTSQTEDSRNSILCDLIDAGFQSVISRLPDEILAELHEEINSRTVDHVSGA